MLSSQLTFIKWNVNPNLVDLGFLAVRWYSLFFGLGFILSYRILHQRFFRERVPVKLLDQLTIYVALGTLIGARFGHCLFYDFAYYRHHLLEIILPVQFFPKFRFIGYQGLASHGGALGILAAILLFSRRYKINFLWLVDRLALVVPLAGCCIRLGNLMNSEIIGKPTHVPWAFVFTRLDALPRHPAQLYEALSYLVILLVIHAMMKYKPGFRGLLFGWLLTLIFIPRFVIEFFKEDQSAFESGWTLNMGQLLSIPLIIAGVLIVVYALQKPLYTTLGK